MNRARIATVLNDIFNNINAAITANHTNTTVHLHTLLADGADQMAAEFALQRQWPLVAPLPFGLALDVAINAHAASAEETQALLNGNFAACSSEV
jgi:hypothetical protein